jgi:N-acetylglucosamine kinase-like BadF-type ATPase
MAEPGVVLAIDGGQSSTLAMLGNKQGQILATGRGGAVGHFHERGGKQAYEDALSASTLMAMHGAGIGRDTVTHICLGMTGAIDESREIVARLFPAAQVVSYHDTITALAGASVAQPGVVVIAGTGSIAYGRLSDGASARAGGWGYALGDEGSGYWLGMQAIRAAARAADGRDEATLLSELVLKHLDADDLWALHQRYYAEQLPRYEIASLAALVGSAANAGDAVAQRLLAEAGTELGLAAVAVIRQLSRIDSGMAVYMTGGVFRAGLPVIDAFRKAVAAGSPASRVYNAAFSPIVGALLLALQNAGVDLSESIMNAIRSSLPDVAVMKPPVKG